MVAPSPASSPVDRSALRAIDCDVHHEFGNWNEVLPYVPQGLQHRLKLGRDRSLARHGFRKVGAAKMPLANDPTTVVEALQARGIDRAILVGNTFSLGVQPNMDLAAALARALNDWTLDRWVRAGSTARSWSATPSRSASSRTWTWPPRWRARSTTGRSTAGSGRTRSSRARS